MADTLKPCPCPFCGSESIQHGPEFPRSTCRACRATGPTGVEWANWNTRTIDDAPDARPDVGERVARALAAADGKDPDAPAWVRFPGNQTEGICWRDQYVKKAEAALAALAPKDGEA
jgi:hypothetical protein